MIKFAKLFLATTPFALVIFAGLSAPASAQSNGVRSNDNYAATAQPRDGRNSASYGGQGYYFN